MRIAEMFAVCPLDLLVGIIGTEGRHGKVARLALDAVVDRQSHENTPPINLRKPEAPDPHSPPFYRGHQGD